MRFRFALFLGLAASCFTGPAASQLTSGISGPEITEGAAHIGYRAAFDPDQNGFAQRIHVERSLSGDIAVRGVVQIRKTDVRAADFDYAQGEVRWQITPDGARWASGLRLDARIRDRGRPGQIALHWVNQVQLTENMRTRFSAIASLQAGTNRQTGTFLQTRGELTRRLGGGIDMGGELYSIYGRASDLLPLSEQTHLAGPFVSLPLTKSLTLRTGALIGLTSSSPDTTFRVFLSQGF